MRVLYAAKLNESELKGDVENSMINHFKQLIEEPITGLKVILGSYTIHLLEGSTHAMKHLIKRISNTMNGQHPFYNHAWVLHFVDECPSKIFN